MTHQTIALYLHFVANHGTIKPTKKPTMNEININSINQRLKDLEANLEAIKNEKSNIQNPTIKGLDKKFSELDLNDAGSVIHLHNAILTGLEELNARVSKIESTK